MDTSTCRNFLQVGVNYFYTPPKSGNQILGLGL